MKVTRVVAGAAVAAAVLVSLNATGAPAAPAGKVAAVPASVPGAAALTAPQGAADSKTLRELAKRTGMRIGTAVDMNALANDATYAERVAAEFNSVTAENVMKWSELEPTRGQLNFGPADRLVAFAKANGQSVRGHTLLWHSQLPAWLTNGVASGDIDSAELRRLLKQHVFTVAGHFRGKIYQWDVANEVIDDNGQLRDTIWLQKLGPGYIADVFRWAHQADPKAKLYINDYNVEGLNAKADAYYALVRQLKADRVPIHGFGMQGHLGVQFGFDGRALANVQRFEALGLETSFTEVDVRMLMPADNPKLHAQANGYGILLRACLLAKRCTSFTVWGFTDKYSWVPGFFEGQGAANLLDENFGQKPAYQAVSQTLALAG
ncbi:endo-1,4-beta-xylanase [Phytohabitans suffuscus]|uniref:endo-1,4-beta-xylanase n=1 Tax=Phytohabitans suffuscus TaxID=624315 RepID=UPI0015657D16|nr:endo-1,4-beta-xylanase [Phytohabitans suffuscus]